MKNVIDARKEAIIILTNEIIKLHERADYWENLAEERQKKLDLTFDFLKMVFREADNCLDKIYEIKNK